MTRPDWVPEGWKWEGGLGACRRCHDGRMVWLSHPFELSLVVSTGGGSSLYCLSPGTAFAIAELLAAERGGWA